MDQKVVYFFAMFDIQMYYIYIYIYKSLLISIYLVQKLDGRGPTQVNIKKGF